MRRPALGHLRTVSVKENSYRQKSRVNRAELKAYVRQEWQVGIRTSRVQLLVNPS
jgi:hypothetical protein